MNYRVVAFYQFIHPHFEAQALTSLRVKIKAQMKTHHIYGTVILAPEGINSTVVGTPSDIDTFMAFLNEVPEFNHLELKISECENVPFKRTIVKLKKVLIPFGKDGELEVNPAVQTGKHLSPRELKQWLDAKDPNVVLVDTRNEYEIIKGTFRGAKSWKLRHFRYFPDALLAHEEELRGKKVVMFCTGGIRCEKASALAADRGLDVYQIEGGILNYFKEVGGAHYEGDCFVFDYRVAVNPKLKPVKYETAFLDGRDLTELDRYEPNQARQRFPVEKKHESTETRRDE